MRHAFFINNLTTDKSGQITNKLFFTKNNKVILPTFFRFKHCFKNDPNHINGPIIIYAHC